MRTEATRQIADGAAVVDVDVDDWGRWVAITRPTDRELALVSSDGLVAKLGSRWRHPIVRLLGDGRSLVVDTRSTGGKNAEIIDRQGRHVLAFAVGDAIANVLANDDLVAFMYFDEGIFGDIPPSSEGLAVFDLHGELQFGYYSTFASVGPSLYECYASALDASGALLVYGFSDAPEEFALLRLDVHTRELDVFATPGEAAGARAVSVAADRVFLHGRYGDPSVMLEGRLGEGDVHAVGRFEGRLRGLPGGRFLASTEKGYQILSFAE